MQFHSTAFLSTELKRTGMTSYVWQDRSTDWALDPKVTPGFEALVAAGAAKFTGEYVVVEYADRFSEEAVQAARSKLERYGVEVSKS